ncbi:hypothetical protein B0I37DRAFT_16357 [Chaetomium sp. MPI-CAGE-AT-0009]|nr:hypothetical protein B0I37DRAFT_16357 [Chaetomium sp. MPI-CAGE-AT-0009]
MWVTQYLLFPGLGQVSVFVIVLTSSCSYSISHLKHALRHSEARGSKLIPRALHWPHLQTAGVDYSAPPCHWNLAFPISAIDLYRCQEESWELMSIKQPLVSSHGYVLDITLQSLSPYHLPTYPIIHPIK